MMRSILAKLNSILDRMEQSLLSLIPNYQPAPRRIAIPIESTDQRSLEVLFHKQAQSKALTRRLPGPSILNRRRC